MTDSLKAWWYDLPQWLRWPLSWVMHGSVVGAAWLVGIPFGVEFVTVTLGGGYYIGQEVTQHVKEGTSGLWPWLDRVIDLVAPVAVMVWLWGA